VENIPPSRSPFRWPGDYFIAFRLESLIGLAPEWVIGFPPES